MPEIKMEDDKEAALEAKKQAALQTLRDVEAELEAVRAESRVRVLAEVQAKVRKYKITRTELAPFFPQIRQPKSAPVATDGTQPKRRGRPKKA